jgi:hypothetical protein
MMVLTGPNETLTPPDQRRRAVPGPGRNDPCPCGSGRKTKRCCGQQRGPSEDQLASAHLAQLARQALPDLAGLSDRTLDHLWEGLMDLPSLDYSLLVTLPKLIGPDLQRLRESVEHDDPDWGWDALTAVARQIDTPHQRARLADAIVGLRDQRRLNRRQAAYALLDLSTRSTRLIGASLLEAVAMSVGVSRTPGGLHIAA